MSPKQKMTPDEEHEFYAAAGEPGAPGFAPTSPFAVDRDGACPVRTPRRSMRSARAPTPTTARCRLGSAGPLGPWHHLSR